MAAANYQRIRQAVRDIDIARDQLNRVARLRVGMISGGPSIDDENAEFERCRCNLHNLVKQAIDGGCRLSKIREVCGRDPVVDQLIGDAECGRDYKREGCR